MQDSPSSRQRISERIRQAFPERQLFLRSDGRVRFVTLAPWFQMSVVGCCVALLGYMAVVSIQLIIRGDLLEAKDQKIAEIAETRDLLADDLETVQLELLKRAQDLEQRQTYLDMVLRDSGINLPDAEPSKPRIIIPYRDDLDAMMDNDGAITADEAEEEAALHLPDSQPTLFGRFSLIPAANAGPIQPDASVSDSEIEELEDIERRRRDLVDLKEQLQRVAMRQDNQAMGLVALTQKQIARIDYLLRDTGVTTGMMLASYDFDSTALPFDGGITPLVAGAKAVLASADAQSPFATLYKTRLRFGALRKVLANLPFGEPADDYYISSNYGMRRHPVTKVRSHHQGVDMAGWPGTGITAAGGGVVVRAGAWGSLGNMVEIDHQNGFRTRYGHMRKVLVSRGQQVGRGDRIGLMGKTGRSTDTHLHFEVWFDDKPRNPIPFIKAAQDVLEIQGRHANEQAR